MFHYFRATDFAPFAPISDNNIEQLAYFLAQQGALYFEKISMKKIVIHSQNRDFGALIRGLLADVEAQLQITTSRLELMRLCRLSSYDLLLTDDVRMFMNGTDAMEQIRQGGFRPQVFIFSHDLSEECVTALLEIGVNQFLTLPIAPERLRRKINKEE